MRGWTARPCWIKSSYHAVEQAGLHGREVGNGITLRRFCQLIESVPIESVGRLLDFLHPGVEFILRSSGGVKEHIRIARTAVLLIVSEKSAGDICQQVQSGLHTRYCVDLATQTRYKERRHHRVKVVRKLKGIFAGKTS